MRAQEPVAKRHPAGCPYPCFLIDHGGDRNERRGNLATLINLPLPERMHAMELLWSSLSQGAQAQDVVPDWHKKIVLARVKDLRAGTGASASLEQTKKNIQKRIKAAVR